MSTASFIKLGEGIEGNITLAVHAGKARLARTYHCMDAMRCLEALLQKVVGNKAMTYSVELHAWLERKQKTRCRIQLLGDMRYFAVGSAEAMSNLVDELSVLQPQATVTPATVFAHLCEVRQAVNKFGLRTVEACAAEVVRRPSLRTLVDSKRLELAHTAGAGLCHCVQLCAIVAPLVIERLGKTGRAGKASFLLSQMAKSGLSPKVTLEGIPEWSALSHVFQQLLHNCWGEAGSYDSLVAQCINRNIATRCKGERLTKEQMVRKLHQSSAPASLCRKRKYKEVTRLDLAAEMRNKGGNPVPYVKGKRTKMSVKQIQRWLRQH